MVRVTRTGLSLQTKMPIQSWPRTVLKERAGLNMPGVPMKRKFWQLGRTK